METFQLEIITPNGVIFNGRAQEATLPGSEGEFGVLPRHVSIVTTLDAGIIDFVKEDGNKESVVINSGFVNVSEQSVSILIQDAVAIAGADESEVAKALSDAKDLLHQVTDSNVAMASVVSKLEQRAQNVIG